MRIGAGKAARARSRVEIQFCILKIESVFLSRDFLSRYLSRLGGKVNFSKRAFRGNEIFLRILKLARDIAVLRAALQRLWREHDVRENRLRMRGIRVVDGDSGICREHGVVKNRDLARKRMMALKRDSVAEGVDEKIVVHSDVALALQQALAGVLIEDVAV